MGQSGNTVPHGYGDTPPARLGRPAAGIRCGHMKMAPPGKGRAIRSPALCVWYFYAKPETKPPAAGRGRISSDHDENL